VRELVQRLVREDGATVILSSHQLSEVEGLCNRVAVLHGGHCVAETEVEELFKGDECWVELETDRPDEALALLSRIRWCSEPGLTPGQSLRARLPRERCAELNTELVKAGFAISAFSPERPRLEDFFRRAIEEGGNGRQR
jgi:ABC-2 type transport system ATP-binding protein